MFTMFLWIPLYGSGKFAKLSTSEKSVVPNVPVFSIHYKGEELKCYPIQYLQPTFYQKLVDFRCIRSDIKPTDSRIEKLLDDGEATGLDETNRIKDQIKLKKEIGTMYTVKIEERYASIPWKASIIASRKLKSGYFQKYLSWILPSRLYISARPQYASVIGTEDMEFRDGGSRGGFFYFHQLDNGLELTFQNESKINWSNISSIINVSNNSESTRRLQYFDLAKDELTLLAGKYWSPYYDLAGITDHFMAYGATSSGAYNDKSDGGASGTGRSNRSIQTTINRKGHLSSRLQYQATHHPNDDINTDYSYGLAGNIVYDGWKDMKVGVAAAYGKFKEITPDMNLAGINGNDISYIAGISYKWQKNLVTNANISYTRNHMNDNNGTYFNGIGAELYLRYDFTDSIRFACGGNWLKPRDSRYKGKYNIRNIIISLQYTFEKKTFDDLVYAEVSIPSGGSAANGEKFETSIAFGLRYLFNLW